MRIVFASGNRGKFREMKAQLEPAGVELLFGGDMEGPHEIEETGETYADNALGGLPGVHSARIVEGSDADRTRWLLGELADKEDRRGRFACAIAVVMPDGREPLVVTRYCPGVIIREPRGTSGFGYDPVFVPDGFDKPFAELGDETKNKISHRALAVKGIAEMLRAVIE